MRFQCVCVCVGIDTKSLLVVSALHILFAVFTDEKRAIEPREKKAGNPKKTSKRKQKYTYEILNERKKKYVRI